MTKLKPFYTWNTKKVANGFEGHVIKMVSRSGPNESGKYIDCETLKIVTLPTRDMARGRAQKWCRYYRVQPEA